MFALCGNTSLCSKAFPYARQAGSNRASERVHDGRVLDDSDFPSGVDGARARYDAAILTNLTHEHLELHGTWEAYRDAKLSLFERLHRGDVAVVNGTGGLVEAINLRTIVLRDYDGTVYVFPNGEVKTLANRFAMRCAGLSSPGCAVDPNCAISSLPRSLSSSAAFAGLSLNIQPLPYGSVLTSPGLFASSLLISVTVPPTPLYRSLVALTDSTSPKRPLASG